MCCIYCFFMDNRGYLKFYFSHVIINCPWDKTLETKHTFVCPITLTIYIRDSFHTK